MTALPSLSRRLARLVRLREGAEQWRAYVDPARVLLLDRCIVATMGDLEDAGAVRRGDWQARAGRSCRGGQEDVMTWGEWQSIPGSGVVRYKDLGDKRWNPSDDAVMTAARANALEACAEALEQIIQACDALEDTYVGGGIAEIAARALAALEGAADA